MRQLRFDRNGKERRTGSSRVRRGGHEASTRPSDPFVASSASSWAGLTILAEEPRSASICERESAPFDLASLATLTASRPRESRATRARRIGSTDSTTRTRDRAARALHINHLDPSAPAHQVAHIRNAVPRDHTPPRRSSHLQHRPDVIRKKERLDRSGRGVGGIGERSVRGEPFVEGGGVGRQAWEEGDGVG